MKKIFFLFLIILSTLCFSKEESEFKVILSPNMKNEKNLKLDINSASKEEMLRRGIALSYTNKIIDYRNLTGGFLNLEELTRISGIGEKTKIKLEKNFIINRKIIKKKLNINRSNKIILKAYGFNLKEIKNIEKYIKKNKRIKNNIELMEILGKGRYNKYKNLINYD